MSDTTRVDLGPVDTFHTLPARITVGTRDLFLVRHESGFRLLSTTCPHQGGTVVDEGTRFECPIHNWRFDRQTGRCLNAPSRTLASYAVAVEHGRLIGQLPAGSGPAEGRRGPLTVVPDLTIRLHAHACLEISRNGFTLLTDPWLDGPAFFSAWAPHPPPAVTGRELTPDAILITHEHSDHFHEPTLRHFNRETAIYVPDFPNQRLPRRLSALGFVNVHVLRFGERQGVGADWSLTAFEPDSYWNDALVLIDAAGFRLFDINDAGINPRIAKMVGAVDVLAVQFSAGASGYPWTWTHLSDAQKVAISEQMCAGKLELIRAAADTYQASAVLPFASHFALWHDEHLAYGRMMRRNTLADVTAAMTASPARVLDLMPGDRWEGAHDTIVRGAPVTTPFDRAVFAAAYPIDESLTRDALVTYLLRLNAVPEITHCEDLTVRIVGHASVAGRDILDLAFGITSGHLAMLSLPPERANLTMTVPLSILTAVVQGDLSWDEAFIGYWCTFDRHPNVYHAGFWRLFQAPYFKRPARVASAAAPAALSAESTVAEVLEQFGAPADRVLRRYGLYCAGCQHATSDSIALAARQHGVDARRVDVLLKELRRAVLEVADRAL